MKNFFLSVFFFFCSIQFFYSQEDGVVSFVIPPGNSLKFNSFAINPTFSFVRQQSSYITLFNKSQWTGFENAPKTYLLSYSGRFKENEGLALGVFQQNYGALTTFGLMANFAHNIILQEDSNLTFGVNLSGYKSGLNSGKVISNFPDSSLDNIPSNTLMVVSPGINYGTAFFDFGLAYNNLVTYNLSSGLLKDDPNSGIQAHVMYTGFLDSYGFFDKSKFSGIVKTELYKEQAVVSGSAVFTIPKGIWAQAGYNSVLGISAGLGFNITPKIAFEYSYGMGLGDISNLGASHILVLAYKLKNNTYDYGDDEEEGAIISPAEVKKTVVAKPKPDTKAVTSSQAQVAAAKAKLAAAAKTKADAQQAAAAKAKLAADAKAKSDAEAVNAKNKLAADAKAKADAAAALIIANKKPVSAVNKAKLAADAKTKADADASAKLAADAKAKLDAQAQAKLAADAKAKADADAQAKLAAEAKAKADAEAQAKLAADTKAKADADAQAKLAGDAKADAEAQAKLAADAKAKADAETQAKLAADAKAKADAEAQAKLAADAKAKSDAAAQAKLAADAKVKADAEAQAKLAADAKAKADAEAQAKLAADTKAKADAEAQAKLAADAKVKADAQAQAKLAADTKAKADAEAQAKLAADAKAKSDAAAQAKLAADAKAKSDAEAQAKLAADAKAKSDAEAQAKLAADAKAKADAEAQVKLAADAKAKSDAAAQAKLAADAKAKADAEAQAKLAADAKAKADAQAKLIAEAKAKAVADAQAKLAADAKAKADAEAQAKLAADAKAKADAAAQAKLAADAKAKVDAENQAKLAAEAKAKADAAAEQERLEAAAAAKLAIEALAKAKADAMPKDEYGKSMDNLTKTLEDSKKKQQQLLSRLDASVANKEKALKELKEENDLSDKGIVKTSVEFKSTSGENAELEAIRAQIAEVNKAQNASLAEFNRLYNERLKKAPKNDLINQNYLRTIESLKAEQAKAEQSNAVLISNLEQIKVQTEIEKKRRIKRAASLNDQDRYVQDLATLKRIKETTKVSSTPLKAEDFDFGDSQSNMQIIKNNKNVETGYYVILAVHSDVQKRDTFVGKTVAAGQKEVNFFYDANSSKYFIYDAKFDNLEEATQALETKGNKPYNGKMVIVKIEK
ncbi:PorP/SprF family type IX secretion system membrane protein [Flavobacterium laiguense]|uniref:Type IX secretion system membrane protein PorP/SprF n=1 Tax=Flavobacterium laiguense TaxID=2169409 RepID=A0A2U1K3N6_9FLAO|nr:PorP/SprF family type IX secretion system membrane protein [Flavobacterium laiguense]PWA11583.1 hypothetical protein DB891_01895 [Flavobacterium laiguense]